ncbi:hypothetical protein H0H87_006233 [Tephrocybe sp. NHM501043]|nr:hypothetical protein H0H87_006233 [Tephrocybe sp. NHM501043]
MDIFNRPPTIAEDTLQYTLHLPKDLSDKAAATTFATCIRTYVDTLLPEIIWHRDAFELKVVADPNPDNNGWMLEGRMRVGDCVDDEWCIVWLLREVSAKWDLVISVFDSDGEFLLIEAAEALPSWVKPSNSENRVCPPFAFSVEGFVYISKPSIGLDLQLPRQLPGTNEDEDRDNITVEDDDEYISAQDAIKLVRDPSVPTFAPKSVEAIVWRRISGYPAAAQSHVHKTMAYVPTDIALTLVKSPTLIQKAVEAFYTRDAIQLRAAHRMNRFSPRETVLATIKMTRTAYAQLVGQKFYPPKVFGHWSEAEGTQEWRWRDVGMKIAVGFEMLYHESKGRADAPSVTTDAANSFREAKKDALRRNPEYIKYIQNLLAADYFRGEIEDSELWRSLEGRAADIFVEVRKEDGADRPSFASQVKMALSDASKSIVIPQSEEDTDDWLNVHSEDFEAMLEKSLGNKKTTQPDAMDVDVPETEGKEDVEERIASAQAVKLKEFAAKVENFVEGEGDLDGARFEDDAFSDEEFSEEDTDTEEGENEETVSDATARQAAMDKLVPGLDPSDYGKMPASFHSNSQRVAPANMDTETIEDVADENRISSGTTLVKPIRQPIIPRDKYDGVDSDDETDEEDLIEEDDSDEDRPQVLGEIEVDMGEEQEEFLEFSRQALGITDDQWNKIVQDRQERGAFLPVSAKKNLPPKKTTSSSPVPAPASISPEIRTQGRTPAPGPRPNVNPNLDSFEAVMQAMDVELSRLRPGSKKATKAPSSSPAPADKGKGKAKATIEDEDEDIDSAMDAELMAALEREDDEDDEDEEPPDYNLIKNFLESFKSQAGLSGPVGNLAGILQPEWQLPRDTS